MSPKKAPPSLSLQIPNRLPSFLPSRPFFSPLSALNNDTKHFGHFSCLPNNAPRSSIHVVCLCAHRAKRAVAIPSFRMMLLKYGLPLRRCHRRTHSLARSAFRGAHFGLILALCQNNRRLPLQWGAGFEFLMYRLPVVLQNSY